MKKANETGIYQLKNGMWAFRFVMVVDGKTISSRKTTDEFGNKLKTRKQAIKARENAKMRVRIEQERRHTITRRTVTEVYEEYCEKGRSDRAYQTIRKQDSLWINHIKERFGKRFVDDISVAEINDYLSNRLVFLTFCLNYTISAL